jgi:TDG/mug DNA glycosylase family protein
MLRPLLRRFRGDDRRRARGAAPVARGVERLGRGAAPPARGAPGRAPRRRARGRGRSGIATGSSAVPDVLAPGLRVLFCGINPGRVSAAASAHFANPRNDFWRLLHAAGFTSRLYAPAEQFGLLREGIGVTNAAYRTTAGSGDLRRDDFAGAAERLAGIADDLRPGWIGFVGKEAYRGAFGERPELGLQERLLGSTQLFVLPSTSPANAAVPWRERVRWFKELAGRASGLPRREAVRGLVVDEHGRVLLFRYGDEYDTWWVPPGGGREPGESDEETLRRELREECGLVDVEPGPLLWSTDGWSLDEPGHGGWEQRWYLVRVPAFTVTPELDPALEGSHEQRWFTPAEVAELPTRPPDLGTLLTNASGW